MAGRYARALFELALDAKSVDAVKANANSNLWGLPAPKSWVEEATNFAGVPVKQAMDGSPMTAERYLAEKTKEAVAE